MARSSDHQDAVARRLALLSAVHAGESEGEPGGEPHPLPAPAVPVPGRHAARRAAGRAAESWVPGPLRGRVVLGPAQLTVVAILVAAGLAVTCWWVLRGQPRQVEAPAPVPVASGTPLVDASPVAASSTASASAGSVTVDVTGKVRRPGIVVLDTGARVVDALEAAGGARPGVDLAALNLARLLVDGEQVVVGVPPPAGAAASAVATPGAPGGPLVNLNTASQSELEALPEVGPVTAQAILAWRDEHGGFTAVDELLEVDGIGDATLGQVAPYVTV
ncbi:MAG TPA: ComEA family DNA-binding protein [Nocardioides sp.]|nr:ComEA family DNA-binding protein [Nocardioides sp.]